MKTAILLVCVMSAISYANVGALRVRRQLVPKEFQDINIEDYLKNKHAVAFQLKCLVYDGPCDRIGKFMKKIIPEVLADQCRNCDPEDRRRAGVMLAHIQEYYPKEWEDSVNKFQGGLLKPEDAQKLETNLGIKVDPKYIAREASSTAATEVSSSRTTVRSDYFSESPAVSHSETPGKVPEVPASRSSSATESRQISTTLGLIFLCASLTTLLFAY